MIFDKIFFKALKIIWVLMKVVGAVGAVGGASCTGDLWVVGVLRETQEFSGFLERGLKIEIKNFAKGVAGEAIKTFGKV